MTGTLDSHMNICKAFDLTLPELYKELPSSKKTLEVKPKAAKADVFVHDKRASSEMLASNVLGKKMMPMMIILNRGGSTHKEETKPGVEKFIYVLEGKIEASIGDEKYTLSGGDTLYFEASLPHSLKNAGTGESRLISVTSPPTL